MSHRRDPRSECMTSSFPKTVQMIVGKHLIKEHA